VEKAKEPPVIVLKPETITVPEGDWARFAVRITGFPRPRVMWLLNGHTIINVSLIHDQLMECCDRNVISWNRALATS
jgi:hypothetical protein